MYFITSVAEDDSRCVGYVKNLEEAKDIVENNKYDLNEAGCYPYVVIEDIPEGPYQYDFHPLWFEFDKEIEKYKPIDFSPDFIEKPTVGFAIGQKGVTHEQVMEYRIGPCA